MKENQKAFIKTKKFFNGKITIFFNCNCYIITETEKAFLVKPEITTDHHFSCKKNWIPKSKVEKIIYYKELFPFEIEEKINSIKEIDSMLKNTPFNYELLKKKMLEENLVIQ